MLCCILVLEKWRPYLVGHIFEIVTALASLQFFISQPKLSGCLTRLLESLADFQPNFSFKHRNFHAVPDDLSRIPIIGQILQAIGKYHGVDGQVVSTQYAELCDQVLLEAVHQAQRNSTNLEFLNLKRLATLVSSGFSQYNGLVVKNIGYNQCITIPNDAS